MIVFMLLLDALEARGPVRVLVLLVLLYFTHLFALAAGLAALAVRALDRSDLRLTAAFAALIGGVLVVQSPGMGGLSWEFALRYRLFQLVLGASLASVSPVALIAGCIWTGLLLWGALRSPWDWRCRAGLLMLAGSALAPGAVGSGLFLFERLHLLALVTLAPLVVRAAGALPRAGGAAVGVALAGALFAVFGTWTEAGLRLDQDRERVTSLFQEAAVGGGDAVASVFPLGEMSWYRAPLYYHLVDRSARELGLFAADNYQATQPMFPVSWTAGRSAVALRQQGRTWVVRRAGLTPLYVVHRADARFGPGQPSPLVDDGRFAVTRLTRTDLVAAVPGRSCAGALRSVSHDGTKPGRDPAASLC
jgi:hypothetical protein